MIKLPEDKPVTPHLEPHNFFIYGKPMSGKSYFASFFPHPLVINTDGNSKQGTAPSIQLRNVRDSHGNLKESALQTIDDIVTQLQQPGVTFQTIVVDVIDDVCVLLEQAICLEEGVQSLSDIPWGKGQAWFNNVLQQFVMDLKALPMNVIYISREQEHTDFQTGTSETTPSLKEKYYNVVNGNCDLVIHTMKRGNSYYRKVEDKRAQYTPEDITDERVRKLLESCMGMFPKSK